LRQPWLLLANVDRFVSQILTEWAALGLFVAGALALTLLALQQSSRAGKNRL
jgi:hypothetical protein